MSYDLMVFKGDIAPTAKNDFIKWYETQTNWQNGYDYNSPDNSSGKLRDWFNEIIKTFPPMNGPLANDGFDNPNLSDYTIAPGFICVSFSWEAAEKARATSIELAKKYKLGIFDSSSTNGDIYYPGMTIKRRLFSIFRYKDVF
jgi:hypothetical protein